MHRSTTNARSANNPRRGASLLESLAATVLLAALLAGVAQLVTLAASSERARSQQRIAALEAANTLDRWMAASWTDLQPREAAQVALSPRARQSLPGAKLTIAIEETADVLTTRRIVVEITRHSPAGEEVRLARLSAFRHTPEDPQP